MNYLSHHAVARAARPDVPPSFYAGNLLPDLLAGSGDGRLRARHAAVTPPGADPELTRGVRLHLATDRAFHTRSAFTTAVARAGDLLRAAPFEVPPRRVFFLAHVFVEVALDGLLARSRPALVDDLYEQLSRRPVGDLVRETAALLGAAGSARRLPALGPALERFQKARYLYAYAEPDGMATALERIARYGAALPDVFESESDRAILAAVFEAFLPELEPSAPALLSPPAEALWYNDRDSERSLLESDQEEDRRRADRDH